jgi:LytS/YehU family sensor histidine kinase
LASQVISECWKIPGLGQGRWDEKMMQPKQKPPELWLVLIIFFSIFLTLALLQLVNVDSMILNPRVFPHIDVWGFCF